MKDGGSAFPVDSHEYTENETYTGEGCAMCGKSKSEHANFAVRTKEQS